MASLFALNASAAKQAIESLPENTMMALRVNASKENIANIKNTTQFGKIFFDQKRLDGLKAVFESYLKEEGEYEKYRQSLTKLGLSDQDITNMIYSRFGVAFSLHEMDNKEQATTIYMWIKNDPQLTDKLFSGMQNTIESTDSKKRIDMDIAGLPSMMLLNKEKKEVSQIINAGNGYLVAVVGVPNSKINANVNVNAKHDDADDFEAQSFSPFFFKNSALNVASSLVANQASSANDLESFALIQETVNAQSSQFLTALNSDGSSFYQDSLNAPGMRENMPSGNNFIEIIGNIKNIPLDESQKADFQKMGALSSFGFWMNYDANKLNNKAFMSLPENKRGYLELLQQPPLDGQPAEWVPTDIQSYSQVSFDLPTIWKSVKTIMETEKPGTVGPMEQQANSQLQMMLQTDINSLLGAFGNVLHIVELPTDKAASKPLAMGRVALVLDIKDEAIMQRIFMSIKGMAGMMAPGAVSDTNLLGFSGIKLNEQFSQGQSFSIYQGSNKLVICLGNPDEIILNALKNPPSGQDQLAENTKYREFMADKNVKDSMIFSYNNAAKALNDLMGLLENANFGKQLEKQANLKGMENIFLELKKLTPKKEEITNILGHAMTQVRFTSQGLLLESISELPPAK